MGKTIRVDDLTAHPDAVGFPAGHPPMGSFLGVPVKVGDTVFGNLYLTDKPGGFTEEDEILIEFLAVTAGSAVSTLRLQDRLRRAALLEDRERIARDLHDSIIQDLFAVGLHLQAASARVTTDPEGMRQRIDTSIDQLDESISSLRRYIFDLRPPVWARPNLRESLADLVGQLSAPYRASVSLEVSCAPDLVPRHLADELVATVKEALSNALRHSQAEQHRGQGRLRGHPGGDDRGGRRHRVRSVRARQGPGIEQHGQSGSRRRRVVPGRHHRR